MSPKTNRLIDQKSPYLLQHAYNPVDWYPWGEEAFKKAKAENKPIFLSVGYSTCHWCHVMEHESFESEQTAKIMNEFFVNVKVDREERPDVDKLYMSFIQAVSGGGGWPMSVFLTPSLEPITGGTYFPPTDSFGRPGFPTVLKIIAQKWRNNPDDVKRQATNVMEAIRKGVKVQKSKAPSADDAIEKCIDRFATRFDKQYGGFGRAPKFPSPGDLDLLLQYFARNKSTPKGKNAKEMLEKTLQCMAMGGIHDHVGKGFHRYSVDQHWHVPHFEKMLYDQGQLLGVYANFFKLTGHFADVVEDIADYVKENLTSPHGGFYSAEDADSYEKEGDTKKKEGAFAVWTKAEVEEVLGDRPCRHNENITLDEVVCAYYDVHDDGNVSPGSDPHGELTGKNVLIARKELREFTGQFRMSEDQLKQCINDAKKCLAERRAERPKPHRDSKILTAWNSLMISGLAAAATAMPERDDFRISAEKALEFVRKYLIDGNGRLLRSAYVDDAENVVQIDAPILAFADDYAFLIQALLDLYEVNFDEGLLKWAVELQAQLDREFWDTENNSGYFLSRSDDKSIIARTQEEQDGAEPSTNSVASMNLVRMADLLVNDDYRKKAMDVFSGAGKTLKEYPYALCKMCTALVRAESSVQCVVVGDMTEEVTQQMLGLIAAKYIPDKSLVFLDRANTDSSWLVQSNHHLRTLAESAHRPTAFICKNFTCGLPATTLVDLTERLSAITG